MHLPVITGEKAHIAKNLGFHENFISGTSCGILCRMGYLPLYLNDPNRWPILMRKVLAGRLSPRYGRDDPRMYR